MKRAHLSLAVLAGLSLVLVGYQTIQSGQSVAGTGDSHAVESDASASVAQVVLDLTLASHQLTVDHERNMIWFATIQPGGEDTLWSVDLMSSEAQGFALPDVDYNGYTSHVRVGTDGVVWVYLPYELVRVDPDSGKALSFAFPEEIEGALPGALDRDTTVPGTWLSGILPDENGVLVARNNVPFLTHVDNDMAASRGAELGTDYAGPTDLARGDDATIYMLPRLDIPYGPAMALGGVPVPNTENLMPRRFVIDGTNISVLSADGGMTVVTNAGGQPGVREAWTRINDVGVVVSYDISAGTLTRQAVDGTRDTLQLEQVAGVKSGGGISATGEKDESNKLVQIPDRITDFVVGDDGSVWFLRHNGTQLARWIP